MTTITERNNLVASFDFSFVDSSFTAVPKNEQLIVDYFYKIY